MSRNYRFLHDDAAYFVSFAVVDWMDVFTRNEYKDILVENLQYCMDEKGMNLYAWCIMTNHVHLVFSSENIKPGQLLGNFKKYTARKVIEAITVNEKESRKEWLLEGFKNAGQKNKNTSKNQFWRHDNKPIELWSPKVIQQKIQYIHNNPVEERIVSSPEDYIYSSARDYCGEKGLISGVEVIKYFEFVPLKR